MAGARDRYHHGDLPEALLQAVDEIVREEGVAAVSIREAARRTGVSNAAPRHHFGDKAGLLTAYATRGFELLAERLREATSDTQDPDALLHGGLAYVEFAIEQPGMFAVMFRPELLHREDPACTTAAEAAYTALQDAVRRLRDDLHPDDPVIHHAATGAWSIVHGFATLWLTGNLEQADDGTTPAEAAELAFTEFVGTVLATLETASDPG